MPKAHQRYWSRARLPLAVLITLGSLLACAGARSPRDADSPSPAQTPRVTLERATPVASYKLDARLDEQTHEVRASGTIRFTNPSSEPTNELYFHLYLNAFENEKTLFRRGSASRSGNRDGHPGFVEVHSLTCDALGRGNLWDRAAKHSPGDKRDRTDIRVPLRRPLQGGQTVELKIDFTSHLPEVVERTGFDGDFHLVAQWFPKLAKREKDGTWAHFAFHPHGEFYADFGDYEISLDVHEDYVVGSTGALEKLGASDGRVQYRAVAKSVHDFAWTAWPHYVVEERTFGDVHVRLMHPPDTPFVTADTWETVERGLVSMGAAYGAYPFQNLTVVQPPFFGSRAGGMEYPQFITTGGSEVYNLLGLRLGVITTIHELGHQWFQGLLASNEMRYPFLDEGLTSYAEARFLGERYGAGSAFDNPFLQVSRQAANRYGAMRRHYDYPIASAAHEFKGFGAVGNLVYARTAVALETLGRVYTFEKLHDALRLYAHTYRFSHPEPDDLFASLEERMGPAVREQAELIFLKKGRVDYRIKRLQSQPVGDADNNWKTTVRWKKTGTLSFPTDVLVRFEDGTEQRKEINGKSGSLSLVHTSPPTFAHLDSERRILLDEDLENNRKYFDAHRPPQTQLFHSATALISWSLASLTL